MKLLHIVTDTYRMLKNHIMWFDTSNVTNYFVMSDKYHNRLIKKRNDVFCKTFLDGFLNKVIVTIPYNAKINNDSYLSVIKKIKPDYVIVSEDGPTYCNYDNIPLIYVHHGFVNDKYFNNNMKNKWNNRCSLYFGIGTNFNLISRYFSIPLSKIKILKGLPQLDYLVNLEHKKQKSYIENIRKHSSKGFITNTGYSDLKLNLSDSADGVPKTILYVFGSNYTDEILQTDFLKMFNYTLHNFLSNHRSDVHLFIKAKKDYSSRSYNNFWTKFTNKYSRFSQFNNISIIPFDVPIYDYLFCDLVLIQDGGSTYIESLLVNPNTVLLQLTKEIQNNYSLNHKFNLITITNYIQFDKLLLNFVNSQLLYDDNNNNNVSKYLKHMIGTDKIDIVCDKIYDVLQSRKWVM